MTEWRGNRFSVNPAIADAASAVSGAVLASDGEPIVADLEMMLEAPGRGEPARAGFVAGGIPILDRGEVVIIPLGWHPPRDAASRLWRSIRSSCEHRHGNGVAVPLGPASDAADRYIDALRAAGARSADWWLFGEHAVVCVIQGEPLPASPTHLSLHLLRARTDTPRDVVPVVESDVDLSWSWEDVVAAAQKAEGAA